MPRGPGALLRLIVHRRTWYVLAWLAALGLTALQCHLARHMFDVPAMADATTDRRDGNSGHSLIDFGGQWITAHLVATGRGHSLYTADVVRKALEEGYPHSDEAPAAKEHDADTLFKNLMDAPPEDGRPDLRGPLYPPTHAVLFAPFGGLPPQRAYHLAQDIFLAMAWVAGLAFAGISGGRVWWPAASILVMIFPGFAPALHLAQNSALSLAILMVGWWCVTRGWDVAGGLVWGLLAYKPVWIVAFLLVPLVTRRWRMLAAMIAAGVTFGLVTLPFVGLQAWFDWLRIGRAAADLYKVDENWIFLSRDLLGIPARWAINFDVEKTLRDPRLSIEFGWAVWALVLGATVLVAWRRPSARDFDGDGAAFVGFGAWATCFHFIYYDTLLALLPVGLLLTHPRRYGKPVVLAAIPTPPAWASYFAPRPLDVMPTAVVTTVTTRMTAVLNSFVLSAVVLLLLTEQVIGGAGIRASVSFGFIPESVAPYPLKFATGFYGTPWDTFVLLALWLYCGIRLLLMGRPDERAVNDRPAS
jgi:hypothetical protein